MVYDFEPTPDKFEVELSDGVIKFRDRLVALAAEEGISQQEFQHLPESKLETLSLKTWKSLVAEGQEPDGLDAAEAILEITSAETT